MQSHTLRRVFANQSIRINDNDNKYTFVSFYEPQKHKSGAAICQ